MGAADGDGSDWIVADNGFDHAAPEHAGSIFALANGMLGVRGGPEERADEHATIFADAYVSNPLNYHERFPGYAEASDTRLLGPGVTAIEVAIDGRQVDFRAAELISTRTEFELRTAMLRRAAHWRLPDGKQVRLETWRAVPLGDDAICLQGIRLVAENFAGDLLITFPIAMATADAGNADDPRISAQSRFAPLDAAETSEGFRVRFAAREIVLTALQRLPGKTSNRSVGAWCEAGECLSADRAVALGVSKDAAALAEQLDAALADGIGALLAHHQEAIAGFWRDAEMAIPDDPELARAIRYNLLQLFLSAGRNSRFGTAAKGLSGAGYEGHCFWDNEVFVLPALALVQPTLACAGIAWRIGKLEQARAHARAIGHARGALYPWRTIAGDECSAHYPTGSAQYHVNAAIAYALEVYLLATGDTQILARGGAAMLAETARLWFDLGHFSERRQGAFLIHGVTGPDEYTALVDNDFYTNAMARRHLLFAARAVELLAVSDPSSHRRLVCELALTGVELSEWRRAAHAMWLPVDPALGVHPQDDTFLDKPVFPGLPEDDANRPLLMRVHPMVLYRHRLSKQGDVIQAHVTAGIDASLAQIGRDFAYYEPLTTHDSTLSMTGFAIAAAWLGEDARAIDYWRTTALVDLRNLHGNSGHGLHMAAMAGSWLVPALGWARLRFDDDCLRLAPRCPKGWERLNFRLRWHGSLIELTITPLATTYDLLDGPPITVFDHGRPIVLDCAPMTIARPGIDAVIFDLDGVLTDTAEAHYRAWKRLADDHAIGFDRQVNEGLKGVDRPSSLRRILEAAGVEVDAATFEAMLVQKNGYYVDSISSFSPANLFSGTLSLLLSCRRAGLKTGLASASRNAADLVDRMGITSLFDHITDAATIKRGKPDPEIFLATARALGVPPERCLGIEDASAGVAAIRDAGMTAFGVGDPNLLAGAQRVFPDIGSISLGDIVNALPGRTN